MTSLLLNNHCREHTLTLYSGYQKDQAISLSNDPSLPCRYTAQESKRASLCSCDMETNIITTIASTLLLTIVVI